MKSNLDVKLAGDGADDRAVSGSRKDARQLCSIGRLHKRLRSRDSSITRGAFCVESTEKQRWVPREGGVPATQAGSSAAPVPGTREDGRMRPQPSSFRVPAVIPARQPRSVPAFLLPLPCATSSVIQSTSAFILLIAPTPTSKPPRRFEHHLDGCHPRTQHTNKQNKEHPEPPC